MFKRLISPISLLEKWGFLFGLNIKAINLGVKLYCFAIAILILLTFNSLSFASNLYAIANIDRPDTAVLLVKDADYVSANLTISNDDRDPINRVKFIKEAQKALEDIIKKAKYTTITLLPITFNVDRSNEVFQLDKSVLTYRILTPLKSFNNDVFDATTALRAVVDAMPKIEDTDYSISSALLALENPEQYRKEILDLIANDIRDLKQRFGKDLKLKIYGLNKSVRIFQLGNIKMGLFINYQIELFETTKCE